MGKACFKNESDQTHASRKSGGHKEGATRKCESSPDVLNDLNVLSSSSGESEYKGVVDLVAVKRNNRSPDELTIMLVQVKGGSARVTSQ